MEPGGRHALVVCDLQPDLLKSIPEEAREALVDALRMCIDGARRASWLVIFTGLRFPPGYTGVSARHRLYGGFKRLNAKTGDEKVHWFMEGYAGSEIEPSLAPQEGDVVVWRQRHLPGRELLDVLHTKGITNATVAGLKAGYAVQAMCQVLCDESILVHVVRECVYDDSRERLVAMLEHFLHLYASITTLEDFLEGIGMNDGVEELRAKALAAPAGKPSASDYADHPDPSKYFYCTDCKRGGHGGLFCKTLLERPDWRVFPDQKWFQDEFWKEYYCPRGRAIVDFADEPQFSRIAMYLKGREWLEDKLKLLEIARGHMPETFVIANGRWEGKCPPPDSEAPKAPWFVKKANSNWGSSIHCCLKPSECMGLIEPNNRYAVQQHVPDPLLMEDGRKCHVKFYMLLLSTDAGERWNLYTYRDGYLCISPNQWTPDDISMETQVTIIRNERMSQVQGWGAWPEAYPKCKAVAAQVIEKAVQDGKLQGRPGQRQFEVFSADFIMDTSGKAWLLEFNLDPVLRDEERAPTTNDSAMVRSALSIVLPWEQGNQGLWDPAGEFYST